MTHMCTNLLCLHTIDNRIEGRWNDHIEIRNKDVNVRWNFLAKTVGEEGEESGDVEDQDDPKVGATGTQSLVLGITGWKVKDSMEDEAIGDRNKNSNKLMP